MNAEKTSFKTFFRYLLVIPTFGVTVCLGGLYGQSSNIGIHLQEKLLQDREKNAYHLFEANVDSIDCNQQKQNNEREALDVAEVMPLFPRGLSAMNKYIEQNLKYPDDAIKYRVEGRVAIRFIVTKNGDIVDSQVVRPLSKSCDREAIRLVNAMPQWTPGKEKGQNVDVYCTIPILFKLPDDSKTN